MICRSSTIVALPSSCLSSLVAKMMSWCEATAGFADVALSDVADKRVMKKRHEKVLPPGSYF